MAQLLSELKAAKSVRKQEAAMWREKIQSIEDEIEKLRVAIEESMTGTEGVDR